MNKGMKNNTKQLTQQVGNANISVNISKQDANMHIVLPLISTVGLSPINAGLVFNLQDREEKCMFGYGARFDKYMNVQSIAGGYSVTNADGSVDKYLSKNGLYNKQTELTLSRVSTDAYGITRYYTLTDKYDNVIKLNEADEYPKSITTKSGDSYTYDFINTTKTINNGHGDVVTLSCNNSTLINRVEYKHNGTLIGYTLLEYTNNYLSKITYYNQSAVIGELSLTLNGDTIIVKDEISGYRIKYTLVDNRVVSFIDGYNDNFTNGKLTTIEYENNKTTITDYNGDKTYTFFDNEGVPLYDITDDGYFVKTRYDKETKKVLSVSSTIPAIENKLPNLLSSESAVSLINIGNELTMEQVECKDPLFSKIVGDTVYRVSADQINGGLLGDIDLSGIATDNITAVVWVKQLTPCTDDSYVDAKLSFDNAVGESIRFDKKTIDGQFDVYVLGLTAKKSYQRINLWIELHNASIEIGGIQILKKGFGSFYTYDENGNLTHTLSDTGTTETEYDANNNPTTSIDKDSSKTETVIEDNRLVKTLSAYGVTTDYTYDSTYKNNLLSTVVSNDTGSKLMETKQEYTSDGRFLAKSIDALGNSTSYEYDAYGNVKKVMNALNIVTSYNYNDDETISSIIRSLDNTEQKAEYTYDDKKRLSKVTLSNGTVYELGYDGKYLFSIKVNGKYLIKYMYNKMTGRVTQLEYGQNGDKYIFTYNGDGQISKIRCLNYNNKEVNNYTYSYNSKKQLEEICRIGSVLCHYSYDDDGNVIEASNETADIKYTYDNLGNVAIKSTKVDGKTINTSYDSVARSKGSQPDSLISAFSTKPCSIITFDDLTGTKAQRAGQDGIIGYGDTSNRNIKYSLENLASNDRDGEKGCLQFWFKPKSASLSSNNRLLFDMKSSSNASYIFATVVDTKVVLNIKDKNGDITKLIELDNCIDFNNWNFVSLTFMYRDDGLGYSPIAEYGLTINGTTKVYKFNSDDIKYLTFGSAPEVSLGNRNSSLSALVQFPFYTTAIYLSRDYLSLENVKRYYRMSKDYLIDNQLVDNDVQTVDFSQTNLYTIDPSIQNQFEIYPLHNSVVSLSGKKPEVFDLRVVSESDKDRTFNFNNKIKRYAYVADGSKLSYNLGELDDFTIAMRVYTDVNETIQYIFNGKTSTGNEVSLYRENGKLRLNYRGLCHSTGLSLTSNEWHTVAVSSHTSATQDSLIHRQMTNIRVILDDQEFICYDTFSSNIKNFSLMIGRKYDEEESDYSLGGSKQCYPFYGQIEMLSVAHTYCESSTIQKLFSENKCISRIHEYDDFGMLKKIDLHQAGESILSNTLTYKTRSDGKHISTQLRKEKFTLKDGTSLDRFFTTDSLGRITAITDSCFGSHSYSYDYRGYLVSANGTNYEYDNNGNITKMGTKVLTYDSTIKDKLISVNGNSISYDDNNPFNPYSYMNYTYTFQGRRLTRFAKGTGYTSYCYNDKGLRIQKAISNGKVTDYEYDGSKLIYQKNSSNRLDFLYDENGELYGFIKDSTDKYFYIRDSLKNILGIVDINGNIVVKYKYDAYGKCTITYDSTSANIGTLNPFRFKGYYYDTESGMYYCQSRYYVPEWGRWLNADNHAFLDFESLNSMNLYVYCGNDPVNYKQCSTFFDDLVMLTSNFINVQSAFMSSSNNGNQSVPWWVFTAIGSVSDIILGVKYLTSKGIHTNFAYSTNTRYMYPIVNGTWRWFSKSSSNFGTLCNVSFKQIVTGDSRAGVGAIAKSFGGVIGMNTLLNFSFNLYDNNWQIDSAMLIDTIIDTGIGVSSYYLAAGVMSFTTASLLTIGVSVPGIVVIGGVIILSIGFEHAIRAISNYWD